MDKSILILIASLVITSLILGGCGGQAEPTTTQAAPTTSSPPTTSTTTTSNAPQPTTSTTTPPPTTTQTPTPSPSTTTPTQTTEQIQGSDNQFTIILDKIIKASSLPTDIRNQFSPPSSVPTLSPGNSFVCIYFSVNHIQDVHMVSLGNKNERCHLVTTEKIYDLLTGQVAVVMVDPKNFATSPIEVPEGANGFLIFEIKTSQKPETLKFIYGYKASWEGIELRGEIDISLY